MPLHAWLDLINLHSSGHAATPKPSARPTNMAFTLTVSSQETCKSSGFRVVGFKEAEC